MALPYATEDQLKKVKKELEKKINTGGGASGEIPTKLSQLTNDTGFITTAALSDYALKSELPDTSEFALKSEIPDVSEFVKEVDLPDFSTYALKTEIPVGGVNYFALTDISDADHSNRHSMMMKNDDSVSGYALKDNQSYNLVMVNKWDVADFGSRGLPINLNGSKERPTYNDDKEIALVEDLPDISNLATKTEVNALIKPVGEGLQVGDSEHTTNINTTADNKVMINSVGEIVYSTPYPGDETRKVIQFKNNDQLSGVTTGGVGVPLIFVSKWDKVEVGGSGAPLNLNGSEDRPTYKDNKHIAFVEDLPTLPEDTASKTYTLKAVNGVLTWVE